ncbi:MAG: hypothetical protein WAM82_02565 [Thermoanaerobaculia bacterium]
MSPIVIEVGKQMNGATFRLSPKTEAMLASRIPNWSPASSIFVSFDTQWDFDRLHGPMWTQIAMLLTGLSEEQIQDLGGFVFMTPTDKEVVFESRAA